SGNKKFFLGTDSAPHARTEKESECGCAGVFSAPTALFLYAEAFDSVGALDKFESFASFNGADFYGLPRNQEKITLLRKTWSPPRIFTFGSREIMPFRAGESVFWDLA
ncbi:MAG: dihydroorotase, partial [Gammaproteobacteria bacterium]|nr:dihydroorotase [Gammaproteobacteria bacterium]